MRRQIALALAFLLAVPPLPAETPGGRATDDLLEGGLRAIYNLDYIGARQAFEELRKERPRSPVGLYGLTMTLWWELTNEFDENNPELEKQFMNHANGTIALCRKLLKTGDPTGEVRLCLGGALGLKGRWYAIEGRWLAAYRDGKQAFKIQQAAIEEIPTLYDAYLGVGIFQYYVSVLPAVVKVLARFVFGKSEKEEGLRKIRLAQDHGQFSRTAARLFLVNIEVNNEKNPAAALKILDEGRKEFPHSPFFHFARLLILDEMGDSVELKSGAEDYLARIQSGAPGYGQNREHQGLFALGNSRFNADDWAGALDIYNDVLTRFPGEDRWITLTLLRRGMAHDLLNERKAALADYKTVLKRRNVWGLHDKATALIRSPYRGRARD